jgi:hypothetical protein
MSLNQEHRLEEIFRSARDLPPLEWAAFLEQDCTGKRIRSVPRTNSAACSPSDV